jgi:hypothetical protein
MEPGDGLEPGTDTKFLQDGSNMRPGGCGTDAEISSDRHRLGTAEQQLENGALGTCQWLRL